MSGWTCLAIAFAAVAGATPLVRGAAIRSGFVAQPTVRRFHARTVPLGGGIAIAAGALAGLWPLVGQAGAGPVIVAGFALAAIFGLIDDRLGLHQAAKLVAQAAIAATVVLGAGLPEVEPLGAATAPVAMLWIMAVMNACNFLDNMDGILAGIAAVCGLAFFWLASDGGAGWTAVAAASVAGAALGFLPYNFAPARIFMGDVGSMSLGYMLAVIPLGLLPAGEPVPVAATSVVLVLGYPLFDMIFVTATRIVDRRAWYLGDADHSTHRLNRLLMSPRRTALAIYLVAAALAALGLVAWSARSPAVFMGAFATGALLLLGFGARLARIPAP